MARRVVVIGGGLAGCMAAFSAQEAGASVTLVSRSQGRTALSSGLLRLAAIGGSLPERCASINEAFVQLLDMRRWHPYHNFDDPQKAVIEATRFFLSRAGELYGKKSSAIRDQACYLNELGTFTFGDVAQLSFLEISGDLEDAALCHFTAYPSFRATYLANALENYFKKRGRSCSIPTLKVEFKPEEGFFHHPAQLADALDDDEKLDLLCESLEKACKTHRPGTLLIPPVLGLTRFDRAKRIEKRLKFPVAELIPAQGSIPGRRLARLLQNEISDSGIGKVDGRVLGFRKQGDLLKALTIRHRNTETEEIEGDAFVLATGKYLGGGIVGRTHKRVVEPIFNLPLFLDGRRTEKIFWGRVSDPNFIASQRFARLGLAVDELGRPKDRAGDICFDNLFAAGHILGGFDPFMDGSSDGVDLVTGRRAGLGAWEAS